MTAPAPAGLSIEKQQRLYDALRRIAKEYDTSARLMRNGERDYGLSGQEVLEMAYDNIQEEAKRAIKGIRRPVRP